MKRKIVEDVNVGLAGERQSFILNRGGELGFHGSASEYIRDLVRRDYEREELRKELWLREELLKGANADESEFLKLDTDEILAQARARRKNNDC